MLVKVNLNQVRIAETLSESRQLKGFTLNDLAEKTGLSYQTVFRYMHNKVNHMQFDTLRKLAQALGISMNYLLQRALIDGELIGPINRKYTKGNKTDEY